MKKRGLYETIPPLKPEDEAKIKGADAKLSEEFVAGQAVEQAGAEKTEIGKTLAVLKVEAEKLRKNIDFFKPYLEKKYNRYSEEYKKFQDLAARIYEENEKISDIKIIEENVAKVEEASKKVIALEKEITALETAIGADLAKIRAREIEQ